MNSDQAAPSPSLFFTMLTDVLIGLHVAGSLGIIAGLAAYYPSMPTGGTVFWTILCALTGASLRILPWRGTKTLVPAGLIGCAVGLVFARLLASPALKNPLMDITQWSFGYIRITLSLIGVTQERALAACVKAVYLGLAGMIAGTLVGLTVEPGLYLTGAKPKKSTPRG